MIFQYLFKFKRKNSNQKIFFELFYNNKNHINVKL